MVSYEGPNDAPRAFNILSAIAPHSGWVIRRWDVIAAYLKAILNHDVYIADVTEQGEIEDRKLVRALDGLKQAASEWPFVKSGARSECISA